MRLIHTATNNHKWSAQSSMGFEVTFRGKAKYVFTFSHHPQAEPSDQGQLTPILVNTEPNSTPAVQLVTGPSDTWVELLRSDLFQIQGVESVHFAKEGSAIDVWAIIPHRDLDKVRKIASVQRDIMRHFVAMEQEPEFFFDFHTMYRESRPTNELVPLRAVQLPPPL